MYQTVPLFTPAENPTTSCVVDMEVIAPVTPVEESAMVQSGAVGHACAKVSVTEVRRVPVTVIVPLLSFPATVEVPPETVGVSPPVMWWPHWSMTEKSLTTVFSKPAMMETAPEYPLFAVPAVVDAATLVKRAIGEVVPRPKRPALFTMRSVFVEEPITNSGAVPFAFGLMENRPQGVVEPIPVRSVVGVTYIAAPEQVPPPGVMMPPAQNVPLLFTNSMEVTAPYTSMENPLGPVKYAEPELRWPMKAMELFALVKVAFTSPVVDLKSTTE